MPGLALTKFGYSQVQVQFTTSFDNNISPLSLWSFQLDNTTGLMQDVYFIIKLNDASNIPVLTMQSPRISLVNGISNPTNEIIRNCKTDYNKTSNCAETYKKDGYFPKGLYYICVVIKEVKSDAELGQNCIQANINIDGTPNQLKQNPGIKKENWFSKNVEFSGYSDLTGVYSNMQAYGSLVPPSYVQWYFNPTASVYDFPISIQLLLSTRQTDGMQNINSFNVQFDANQFKNMLMQRAMSFIQEKVLKNKLGNLNVESLSSQFNSVKGKLESPGAVMELGQIKQLDSLKNSLNDLQNMKLDSTGILGKIQQLKSLTGNDSLQLDSFRLDSAAWLNKLDSLEPKCDSLKTAKIDSLKKKIKVLSWLEEKKPYYDKLMKQKDELAKKLEGFNLDSLNEMANSFTSEYDVNKLKDPNSLYAFMDKNKLFRKFEKVMTAVKSLSFGRSYPTYSDFTFKGIPVDGFSIELEKWNTYIGFTYGSTLQGIMPNPTDSIHTLYNYKRNVIGGSAGYGSKEKSHIHFTILSFDDDPTSITIPDSLVGVMPKPQSNQVLSTDFKLSILKNKLSFYGELAGSQTIRNITLVDSSFVINTSFSNNNPREWFANIFLQRDVDLNTTVDFAFKAGMEANLFKNRTKISVQAKRVGPGFMSFGNPFMIRDIFNIEGKISQAFWKNRIQLSGFIRRNIDNLENTKLLTSQLYNFGFDLTVNIPKWPTLKVAMMPYIQSNDSVNMDINVIMANSNYAFKIRKVQVLTNATYMHQNGTARDSSMNFSSHYATLLNTFLLSKTISLNLTQNYFHINNRYGNVGTYTVQLSGSVLAFKKWNNTIGATFSTSQNERRYGGYYQTSIQFLKYFSFNIRAEYNRYDILNYTIFNSNIPFDQIMVRGVLITRW